VSQPTSWAHAFYHELHLMSHPAHQAGPILEFSRAWCRSWQYLM